MKVIDKLKKWQNKIKDVKTKKLPLFLSEHGFEELKHSDDTSGEFVYYHKEEKIVIKHSYINSIRPKKSIIAPTIIDRWERCDCCIGKYAVIIQPLCRQLPGHWSVNGVKKFVTENPVKDNTYRNVALYKNKYVYIDW